MKARRIKGRECTITIEVDGKRTEISSNEKSPIMTLPPEGFSFSIEATIVVSGRWYRGLRVHGHQTQIEKECMAFDKTLTDDIRRRLHLPPYEGFEFNLRSWFLGGV